MPNTYTTCADCGDVVHRLEVFPRGICLRCYETEQGGTTIGSAMYDIIVTAFGGGVINNGNKEANDEHND